MTGFRNGSGGAFIATVAAAAIVHGGENWGVVFLGFVRRNLDGELALEIILKRERGLNRRREGRKRKIKVVTRKSDLMSTSPVKCSNFFVSLTRRLCVFQFINKCWIPSKLVR